MYIFSVSGCPRWGHSGAKDVSIASFAHVTYELSLLAALGTVLLLHIAVVMLAT